MRFSGGCSQKAPVSTTRQLSRIGRFAASAAARYSRISSVCSSGGRTIPARISR